MKMKWVLIIGVVTVLARTAPAAWTPLQTDFGPYLRIVSTNDDVLGLRFGLFSENKNVYGSSVSFWSDTIDGSGGGLQMAVWRSRVKHSFTGIQAALLGSAVHDTLTGVSVSLLNAARVVHGVQLGGFVGEGWDMEGWTVDECVQHIFVKPVDRNFDTEELIGAQIGLFVAARRVCGMQMSVIGPETDDLTGIQLGLCPVAGEVRGIQLGAINTAATFDGEVRGIQLGAINGASKLRGIQLGIENLGTDAYGIQLGAVNWSDTIHGIQLGAVNWSDTVYGLQCGVLNVTETLIGLQIGLLNYVGEDSPNFMPFVNLRF